MFKRKPRIHKIIKVWSENGVDCWLMSFGDFNHLYSGTNVVEMNGKIMATLEFAGNPIIIHRQDKKR